MDQINWAVCDGDAELIRQIVERAKREAPNIFGPIDAVDLQMSLTAYHLNDCPLRLKEMLEGRLFDLLHDVSGLHACVDRLTGRVEGFFVPRYASGQS